MSAHEAQKASRTLSGIEMSPIPSSRSGLMETFDRDLSPRQNCEAVSEHRVGSLSSSLPVLSETLIADLRATFLFQ